MDGKVTGNDLIVWGKALYGPRFIAPLADDLGVNERTVRRWISGTKAIPDGLAAELRALGVNLRADIAQLIGDE